MTATTKNSYIRWPHLWMVVAGVLTLIGSVLALHSSSAHHGAITRPEQVQFEKRMVERLKRIETVQTSQGKDIRELLRRLK